MASPEISREMSGPDLKSLETQRSGFGFVDQLIYPLILAGLIAYALFEFFG
jgi:hypothetical protein